jgi:uncharacterized RDD family membrane protein YckC
VAETIAVPRGAPRNQRSLVTPEGVDLALTLAYPSQRFAAFVLDIVIMIGCLIVTSIVIAIGAYSVGRENGFQFAVIVWMLGFFLLRNCYFILFEMGPRAATWGKRVTGLRVVSRNGSRLTADAVIARNLMRELEFYLPLSFLGYQAAEGAAGTLSVLFGLGWACLFLFFPFFNKDRLRIGDMLAGTWVINAPKRSLSYDVLGIGPVQGATAFTDEQLDAYGVYELQTLEQVLRRGDGDAVAAVAYSIRYKIGVEAQEGDAEFLNAYYDALRARLERNLLFGRRRKDKFDKA